LGGAADVAAASDSGWQGSEKKGCSFIDLSLRPDAAAMVVDRRSG